MKLSKIIIYWSFTDFIPYDSIHFTYTGQIIMGKIQEFGVKKTDQNYLKKLVFLDIKLSDDQWWINWILENS